MKKKKKRNYYNLIVHAIKLFVALGYLFIFIFALGHLEIIKALKKYEGLFMALSMSSFVLMYISIILADKYKNKITIDIEKPKAPHTYKIIDEYQMKQSIKDKLSMMNYQVIPDVLRDTTLYGMEQYKWYYAKGHKNVFNLWAEFDIPEFTKETSDYLITQRENIQKKLKQKERCFCIIFLIRVEKKNKELSKYLKRRTVEGYQNYGLMAILVEEEQRIYVPLPEWADVDCYLIRRRFEKILKGSVIKEKKGTKKKF